MFCRHLALLFFLVAIGPGGPHLTLEAPDAVAAGGGKKGYRAVSDRELADIKESGFRPDPKGKSMEDKWFADTKAGAEQHRSNFPDNRNIVEAEVPADVYGRSHVDPGIDGFGGFAVPPVDQPLVKPILPD